MLIEIKQLVKRLLFFWNSTILQAIFHPTHDISYRHEISLIIKHN